MGQLTGEDGGRGWDRLELGVDGLVVEEQGAVVVGESNIQELCMPEARSAENSETWGYSATQRHSDMATHVPAHSRP
jgi:hypothetical protein